MPKQSKIKQKDCYLELERLARAVSTLKIDDDQLKNFYHAFKSPLYFLDEFEKEKQRIQAEKEKLEKEFAESKGKTYKPKAKKVYVPNPYTQKAAFIELETAVRQSVAKPFNQISLDEMKIAFERPLKALNKVQQEKDIQKQLPKTPKIKPTIKKGYLTEFMEWPKAIG